MKDISKLKRFHFVFLVVIFAIIKANFVNAYFYNITYSCKDNICIKGDTVTWNVVISNDGKSEVEYVAIEFLDVANNSVFASLKIPYYPLSDKRGNLIVVKPNEKVTINLTDRLPKANFGQFLVYYSCFTATITDSYIIARDNIYEIRQCYNQNETMLVFECVSNDKCKNDEFCSFNKCLKLKCKDCQYIKDHKCINYECCSSEQCKFDEACKNDTCQKLNCAFSEYTYNHTCSPLNCAFDEFITNKTCKKLNCSYGEFAFNSTCKELNCNENEFVQNHTCKLLECKENEYAKNHACNTLECLYNETIFNHTCKPLNCYFFQDTADHSCINNKQIMFKLSLEIIAIIALITFFIIDFRKYEKKHNENLSSADKNINKKLQDKNMFDKTNK